MRPREDGEREIFRFEYHPVEHEYRRLRVLVDQSASSLYCVTERRGSEGWQLLQSQEIEYFEYSDEESPDPPAR